MITDRRAFTGKPRGVMDGLSTDTKPTNCANGSSFREMDTGKVFLFDAAGGVWHEQPQGGGETLPRAEDSTFGTGEEEEGGDE